MKPPYQYHHYKDLPQLLKEVPNPPRGLYVRGQWPLTGATVAVVGTRGPTREGVALARRFAKELAEQEIIVISGLALGIDAAAHSGALDAGGKTIAVLGNGIDKIHPQTNQRLGEKILEGGGAIVSEYPPGIPAYQDNFLQRNRIISGLSLGVVVIEAPFRSGALVTARHAVEQNREVFVVPGPLSNHNYQGSHRLIRSGAALVTSIEDICEEINLPFAPAEELARRKIKLTPEQDKIFNFVKSAGRPVNVDNIIETTKINPSQVNQIIAFLVINDMIKESTGKYHL